MSMSKDDDKKKKEHNEKNKKEAAKWQSFADQSKVTFDKHQEELDKLKSARKKLVTEIDNLTTVEKEVKDYPTSLTKTDFKGTLRDKFDTEVTTIADCANSDKNKHQSNLALLDTEIAKRDLEQGDLGDAIKSALGAVGNFLASLI